MAYEIFYLLKRVSSKRRSVSVSYLIMKKFDYLHGRVFHPSKVEPGMFDGLCSRAFFNPNQLKMTHVRELVFY